MSAFSPKQTFNLRFAATSSSQRREGLSITQIFVVLFATLCALVSAAAIYRVWRSPRFKNKVLWTVGCLFGFVGFALEPRAQGDLLLQFGVQIPVVILKWGSVKGLTLETLFPIVAVVALVRRSSGECQPES